MTACLSCTVRSLYLLARMLCTLFLDTAWLLWLCLRPRAVIAAANLLLRKQLALYQAHHGKPRRTTNATRLSLVLLAQGFDWRPALAMVQPKTFQRWRRQGCHLFWGWAAPPGRPPSPVELPGLLWQMARDTCPWGQRRIAKEDDRSPPDFRPPRHDHPYTAARATPADMFALRPAVGTGCWWNRASASARSAKPLSKSASQAASLQRAA